jgi:uncharacterized membrane protein
MNNRIINSTAKPARLISVNALRGQAIALMALDHANHSTAHNHPQGEMWGGAP